MSPLGDMAIAFTISVCPSNILMHSPSLFQTRRVLSTDPLTTSPSHHSVTQTTYGCDLPIATVFEIHLKFQLISILKHDTWK
jgi:hypothetical protein